MVVVVVFVVVVVVVVVVGTAAQCHLFRASAGLTAPAYQSQPPHLESGEK